MDAALPELTPAPGNMIIRPFARRFNAASVPTPFSAEGAHPEVSMRWQPSLMTASSASCGSRHMSKAL